MSLLTGEPRSATVRAISGATVVEIGRRQYEPLLRARPALLDELADIVAGAAAAPRAEPAAPTRRPRERTAIRDRIRAFVLGERD